MIRLSNLTAIDFTSTEFTEDLSVDKLYVYSNPSVTPKSFAFIKDDSYKLRQMSRNNAVGGFFDDVLLGTSNFYPEQGLGFVNFHSNHEIRNVIDFDDVPLMQYKRAFLYFSQGSLTSANIIGHYLKIYCSLSNGETVDLVNMIEFLNDTNIKAKTAKLFENQIFNEALEITFPDIEFIVNSTNSEIIKIKNHLFGNDIPKTYFIEYTALTAETIDDFVENGLQFTKVNLSTRNYQTFKITEEQSELFGRLQLTDNGYSLLSSLEHTVFDIETFIKNTYQINDENFDVSHVVSVIEFNALDEVLNTSNLIYSNPTNEYNPIKIRPLLNISTNHAMIEVMIKISNGATGLTISKTSKLLLTNLEVDKFKSQETFAFEFEKLEIKNIVEKKVNQIVQESTTPKILYIQKKIFVEVQESMDIAIVNADKYVKIQTLEEIQDAKLFLRIGDRTIESENHDKLIFKIPQDIYYKSDVNYLLLDENFTTIQQGKLVRS